MCRILMKLAGVIRTPCFVVDGSSQAQSMLSIWSWILHFGREQSLPCIKFKFHTSLTNQRYTKWIWSWWENWRQYWIYLFCWNAYFFHSFTCVLFLYRWGIWHWSCNFTEIWVQSFPHRLTLRLAKAIGSLYYLRIPVFSFRKSIHLWSICY